MKVIAVCAVAMLTVSIVGCTGLVPAKTEVSFDPLTRSVKLYNSKDVAIKLQKAEYHDSSGRGMTLEGLDVQDTASTAAVANAVQMQRVTDQIEQHGKNIAMALQGISNIASQIMPFTASAPSGGTSLDTQWGSLSRNAADPNAIAAYYAYLAQIRGQAAAPTAATGPTIADVLAAVKTIGERVDKLEAVKEPKSAVPQ